MFIERCLIRAKRGEVSKLIVVVLTFRTILLRYQASKDDIVVYEALSKPVSSEYVNVSRWINHIEALLRIS